MKKQEFDKTLKDIGLSRQEFANMTGLSYGAVSNWHDEKKPVPGWVKSWLENYIKADSYEQIRHKVFNIENVYELALEKIFSEINPDYKELAVLQYKRTHNVEQTIKLTKIASAIQKEITQINKCSSSDIEKIYKHLQNINFKPTEEDKNKIIDCINGNGWK